MRLPCNVGKTLKDGNLCLIWLFCLICWWPVRLARAVGIHLIISTQRPTKSVITDGIIANFQCRAAFRMQRKVDSNWVIDSPKAFSLSGPGEMLFYRYPDLQLVQCAMIEDYDIERLVSAV